jgi:hypothetical protein
LVIDSIKFIDNGGERESTIKTDFPSSKRLNNVSGTKVFNSVLAFANKNLDGVTWQTFFDSSGSEIIYSSLHESSSSYDYTLQYFPTPKSY